MNMYIEDSWMTFDPATVMCTLSAPRPGQGETSHPKRLDAHVNAVCAEFITNALRAADEAQAEGLQDLSIARINLIYHLLEDSRK